MLSQDEEDEEESLEFKGNVEHLLKLQEGIEAWNSWRLENPKEEPALGCLSLRDVPGSLRGAHLENAELWYAHLEGVEAPFAHLEKAELGKARLKNAYLWKAHLEEADLMEAHLEEADLREAHLEEADLREAHLEKAGLWKARLEKADLTGAHLEGANLTEAHLEGANLTEAHLEGANLTGAHLEKANLAEANLEGANLYQAHVEMANLQGASLKGSCWLQADLSGADLRIGKRRVAIFRHETNHLQLDDTRILKCRFAPGSQDPWSVIRRAYSGPALLFHLLFLLVFLVPYLGRAAYWKGINAAQEAAAAVKNAESRERERQKSAEVLVKLEDPKAREEFEARLSDQNLDVDRSFEILEEVADEQLVHQSVHGQRDLEKLRVLAIAGVRSLGSIEQIGLCLQPIQECGSWQPIGPLLLGLHQKDQSANLFGWLRSALLQSLALALILYNFFRGVLTYYVSGLRDAEIRGGYSPRLREYIWVYYLHAHFLQYVPVAGLTAAGIQIAEWLLVTDVVLPAL